MLSLDPQRIHSKCPRCVVKDDSALVFAQAHRQTCLWHLVTPFWNTAKELYFSQIIKFDPPVLVFAKMQRHMNQEIRRSRHISRSFEEDWDTEDPRSKATASPAPRESNDLITDNGTGASRSGRRPVDHTGPERLTDVLSQHWEPTTTRKGRHQSVATTLPQSSESMSATPRCQKKSHRVQDPLKSPQEKNESTNAELKSASTKERRVEPEVKTRTESSGPGIGLVNLPSIMNVFDVLTPSDYSTGDVSITPGKFLAISSLPNPSEDAAGPPRSSSNIPTNQLEVVTGEQANRREDDPSTEKDKSEDSNAQRRISRPQFMTLQPREQSFPKRSESSSGLSDAPPSPQKSLYSQSRLKFVAQKNPHKAGNRGNKASQPQRGDRQSQRRKVIARFRQPAPDAGKKSTISIKDPPFVGDNAQSVDLLTINPQGAEAYQSRTEK